MKLPEPLNLVEPEHRFLYEHDKREFHNPDRRDFTHQMYMDRFHRVLQAVRRFKDRGRVLDIGCAQGNFALSLAEQGFDTVALDLRRAFLTYLQLKRETGRLACVNGSLDRLPFRRGSFDVVLVGEVVEHVAYPERLLADAAELLASDGLIVLTTPNGDRLHCGLPSLSAIRDREELKVRQFQPDGDGHLFLLTRSELLGLVQAAALTPKAHVFFGSPWMTGRLRCRHVSQWLPVSVREMLDRWTLRLEWVTRFVAEGQLLVAGRRAPSPHAGRDRVPRRSVRVGQR